MKNQLARPIQLLVLVGIVAPLVGFAGGGTALGQGLSVAVVAPHTVLVTDDGQKPAISNGIKCSFTVSVAGGSGDVTVNATHHLTLLLLDTSLTPPAPAYVPVVQQPQAIVINRGSAVGGPSSAQISVSYTLDGLLQAIIWYHRQ